MIKINVNGAGRVLPLGVPIAPALAVYQLEAKATQMLVL
jgi:hypothetical protein